MLFIKVGSKYVSLACATSHSLDIQMNTVDTSTKDNGNGRWQTSEAGMRSWTVSSDNLVASTGENGAKLADLYPLLANGTLIECVFSLQSNIPDYSAKEAEGFTVPEGGWTPDSANCLKGKGYITALNISAPLDGKATAAVTITGCGALEQVGNGPANAAATAALAGSGVKVPTAVK